MVKPQIIFDSNPRTKEEDKESSTGQVKKKGTGGFPEVVNDKIDFLLDMKLMRNDLPCKPVKTMIQC